MSSTQEEHAYQVTLPEFEGPLDLLLHLVKRHELNILDIPIGFITDKYIEYLDLMQSLSLDIAGEYLLMAATLAHLKSRELLPKHDEDDSEDEADEESEDPRQELIRRLLDYQRYKDVAERLGDRPALGREVYPRGTSIDKDDRDPPQLAEVGVFTLLSSLGEVLKRAGTKLSYDVVVDRISITDRINDIADRLAETDTVHFLKLFTSSAQGAQGGAQGKVERHEVVVTFLAILEMARLRMIRVLQSSEDGEIYLTRTSELRQVEELDESYN